MISIRVFLFVVGLVQTTIEAARTPAPIEGQDLYHGLPQPVPDFVRAVVDLRRVRDTDFIRPISEAASTFPQLVNVPVSRIEPVIAEKRGAALNLLRPVVAIVPAVLPPIQSFVTAIQDFLKAVTADKDTDKDAVELGVLLKLIVSTAAAAVNGIAAAVEYMNTVTVSAEEFGIGLTMMISGIFTCTFQILINVQNTLPELLAPVDHIVNAILDGFNDGIGIIIGLITNITQNTIHGVDSTIVIIEDMKNLNDLLEELSSRIEGL